MALLHCDFFSDSLGMSSSMVVILPQKSQRQIGLDSAGIDRRLPTLYLLHGLSDDHSIWGRRTSLERYAAAFGLAVVMPNGHRSFYTDMADGLNYETFISQELPEICRSFFPLSHKREETFVAGLSMGGYGALKMALKYPDRFSRGAGLSGVADIQWAVDNLSKAESSRIFGASPDLRGSALDLFQLAEALPREKRPALYQCCGTEDFLYQDNIRLRDHLRALQFDLTYEEGPGQHNWDYWDVMIQRVLAWLPLKSPTT